MSRLAQAQGLQVTVVDDQRKALAHLRSPGADILWAGSAFRSGTLPELLDLTRAGYPDLPTLVMVPRASWGRALPLLDAGAFDLLADDDDPRMHRAALRRAQAEVRARAWVREERGRILGVQARVWEVGPAVAEMLEGLSNTLHAAVRQPDISLRAVEVVCVQALSRFLEGSLVVILVYERTTALLRPRSGSADTPAHLALQRRGLPFPLRADETWQGALDRVAEDEEFRDQARHAYGQRHAHVASMGPRDDPYGVVACFPDRAAPPSPEEREILSHLALHAGHCLRVARHFRTVLRRGTSSA
jgi:hypothetical protein